MEIIRGMDEKLYRAREEISQSQFKAFRKPTAKHAKYALGSSKEATDSMIMGTCLHALLLEGKTVYAVVPECDARTKEGKAIKAQFAAENEGKVILSAANAEKVKGMAAGVRDCAEAMALLNSAGDTEISVFWDGMKARIDKSSPVGIADLKTTSDASTHGFSGSIEAFGYHIQAAHYLEAAAVAGLPCEDFYIIAVENVAPFVAGVVKMPHQSIEIGRIELETLKGLYKRSKETGEYPGFFTREIGLPTWKIREFQKEMQ